MCEDKADKRPVLQVGHLKSRYLAPTETFIYAFLCQTPDVDPLVFTNVARNLDAFPTTCSYLAQEHELGRNWKVSEMLRQLDYPACFARLARESDLDLMHAHFGHEGIGALGLKEQLGLPLVTSFYGVDASQLFRSDRRKPSLARLFQQGDVFTVLGSDMKRRVIEAGCPEEKIHIVHLGVDVEALAFQARSVPKDGDPIRLLFCGRLVEKKGFLDAFEAFVHLADRWPTLEFHVVGGGPWRRAFERAVRRKQMHERVFFKGVLPHGDVIREMKDAHLFVLPSKAAADGDMEGTPTVLLEAQALGLPVVSTRHADIPEVVIDGKSGFLVDEGDVVDLAARLNLLLEQPTLWPTMGQVGHAHVKQNYNIYQEAVKLRAVYDACLN